MKRISDNAQYVGINIGSVSVNVVISDGYGELESIKEPHLGNPQKALADILDKNVTAEESFYEVSGNFGESVSDNTAIESGLLSSQEKYDLVLSLGGESFTLYILDDQNHIINILSQNKCAAGSGEFFIQQIERLNLSLEDAIELAAKGKNIRLASRCSVHCKSDITHKLNKGESPLEDVLSSLLSNMVNQALGLINQSKVKAKNILLIGGLSLNRTFVKKLRDRLPNVNVEITEFSPVYEAYGTALLVQENPQNLTPNLKIAHSFSTLPNLKDFGHLVKLMKMPESSLSNDENKEYILGIDVGSTTTKAVVMEEKTSAILGSFYGRTNGNPIQATKDCLREIIAQIGDKKIKLVGVTGSGRQMVGAYLGTSGIFNEISAHSMGAAYFDPEVDTIFEIGGQDAKYMFLQNEVPVDYAMNASCSAGTGSFLEESAKCDLNVKVTEICDVALNAKHPVRFKADCAAFINSDIRTALQEGYERDDIISGLVYSISNNYLNKVKGSRPIGNKIFFQGGVAKNNAVGYAFAQLTGREIIIPPFPELMGAFGIALMTEFKYNNHLITRMDSSTTINSLIETEMRHTGQFVCKSCENFCQIERYQVGDRKFPFGGKCTKWEHSWKKDDKIIEKEDVVAWRNGFMYNPEIPLNEILDLEGISKKKQIGIPRALLTHALYPLFSSYFTNLGFEVILSDIEPDVELLPNAPFCYPIQIMHGAVANLVKRGIQLIFIPYIHKLKRSQDWVDSTFCPITLSAPYLTLPIFDQSTFLTPELDYSDGYLENEALVELVNNQFNIPIERCQQAYDKAAIYQNSLENQIKEKGQEILARITTSDEIGIIVVGRSYNVYPAETSQSIPKKLVSMGVNVIPFDFLEPISETHIPWYFANYVEEAINLVHQHGNLFLLYINNYSCTVDAFIQNHVRSEMGSKPYLLLELDAHVADAGTQTRLEAFLEIINNYQLSRVPKPTNDFLLSKVIEENGKPVVIASDGERMNFNDERIKVYMPCFSEIHTALIEKFLINAGINMGHIGDIQLEYPMEGLKHCSGKECVPLPIVLGQILHIVKNRKPGEISGYMILTGGEPCVVCQYKQFMTEFLIKNKIKDVFFFGINKEYHYIGFMNRDFIQYAPKMMALGDLIHEVSSTLQVVGEDGAMDLFQTYLNEFLADFTEMQKSNREIDKFVQKIKTIPTKISPQDCPKVLLDGDFFVRYSPFFLKEMKALYAQHGIIVKSNDLFEIFVAAIPFGSVIAGPKYRDRYVKKMRDNFQGNRNLWDPLTPGFYASQLLYKVMTGIEKRLRKKFDRTGLIVSKPSNILHALNKCDNGYNSLIFGEATLSVGRGMEVLEDRSFDGLVLTGPQYCLPYKIAQGILKPRYLEQQHPLMVFDAEISAMSPNMKRLIIANIEQIKRQFKKSHRVVVGESARLEDKKAIK